MERVKASLGEIQYVPHMALTLDRIFWLCAKQVLACIPEHSTWDAGDHHFPSALTRGLPQCLFLLVGLGQSDTGGCLYPLWHQKGWLLGIGPSTKCSPTLTASLELSKTDLPRAAVGCSIPGHCHDASAKKPMASAPAICSRRRKTEQGNSASITAMSV